jgi:3-hydroxy-D-aspartate aldolase
MISAPAAIGMHVSEVDTPALILELDVLEENVRRMQKQIEGRNVYLRPHSKTHKSTAIANLQIAAGAVGVCCQKVSEAEIMVAGGVRDVFISNEVVGPRKVQRVAALAHQAKVSVCVDAAESVAELAAAVERAGTSVHVLVEIDVGANRCGVDSPEEVLRLAKAISSRPGLRFAGLQAYQGTAQHMRTREERRAAIEEAARRVRRATDLLARNGFSCDVVAGAGTGTFEFEIESGVYNELQVGSYVFMDADYGLNKGADGEPITLFGNSLFILATIMSAPTPERRIVDAGLKTLSVDSGMPSVAGVDGVSYIKAADEHGRLELRSNARSLPIGEKIRLIPGHCDPTVNLHDWYVGIRNDHVECLWPVSARGAVF